MSRGEARVRLEHALADHGCTVRGSSAQCPGPDHANGDRRPSLSISSRKDGDGVVINCHRGCATDDILESLGMSAADLFDEPRQREERRQVVAEYDYVDEDGVLLFRSVRYQPKEFRQYRIANGRKEYRLGDVRRVLYRLPAVIEAVKNGEPVWVAEGEKDADRLTRAGVVATCNPMGAGKWRDEYADALAGADVIIVADRDEPGRKHAATVAASLRGKAKSARVVEPAVDREKADASDHFTAGHGLSDFVPVTLAAPDAGNAPPADGEPERRTWRPRDLTPVLDGTWQAPQPTVGRRDDGRGLFYPGRQHAIAAEAEAGKTWLALVAIAAEITAGNSAVHLDFEDDEGGIAGRLLAMGCPANLIRDRFAYIGPEDPLGRTGRTDLGEALGDLKPALVILDGITEAMSLHGLELKDNTDVAKFGRMLPRWIASHGPAVVSLDHVTKDRETRGGHAIGGIHKLNGINGAMYLLENKEPFGIGLTGRSRLLIRKDRPGQLRRHGIKAHDGLFWYADLAVASHGEEFAEAGLEPPELRASAQFRPTAIMADICRQLDGLADGLSKNAIEGAVKGRREYVRLALELLVNEGYVKTGQRGRATLHTLTKPFPET